MAGRGQARGYRIRKHALKGEGCSTQMANWTHEVDGTVWCDGSDRVAAMELKLEGHKAHKRREVYIDITVVWEDLGKRGTAMRLRRWKGAREA